MNKSAFQVAMGEKARISVCDMARSIRCVIFYLVFRLSEISFPTGKISRLESSNKRYLHVC